MGAALVRMHVPFVGKLFIAAYDANAQEDLTMNRDHGNQ